MRRYKYMATFAVGCWVMWALTAIAVEAWRGFRDPVLLVVAVAIGGGIPHALGGLMWGHLEATADYPPEGHPDYHQRFSVWMERRLKWLAE